MKIAAAAVATVVCSTCANAHTIKLRFLGEAVIPTGTMLNSTAGLVEIGGLSGIEYLPCSESTFWAISDDRINPRFVVMNINLTAGGLDGRLGSTDVTFLDAIPMYSDDGGKHPDNVVDPESVRYRAETDTLVWSSEGDANNLIGPSVTEIGTDGSFIRELNFNSKFQPTADMTKGIRNNLATEGLTFSLDGKYLWASMENALYQDGPATSVTDGSPVRISKFDIESGQAVSEYVYHVEPVVVDTIPTGGFATNGLCEMLALSDTEFIFLERSFSSGVTNFIRLYRVSLDGATDVMGRDSIGSADSYEPMSKSLLLDVNEATNLSIDNIEGITFGPVLESGEITMYLIADNNFSPLQWTQVLAFAVTAPDWLVRAYNEKNNCPTSG